MIQVMFSIKEMLSYIWKFSSVLLYTHSYCSEDCASAILDGDFSKHTSEENLRLRNRAGLSVVLQLLPVHLRFLIVG